MRDSVDEALLDNLIERSSYLYEAQERGEVRLITLEDLYR